LSPAAPTQAHWSEPAPPFLSILARQSNDLADDFGIVGRPVEEHGHDQYGHDDEYDRSNNALF